MLDPSKEINTPQELFCYGIPASISDVNPKILIILMVLNTFISITATTGNLLVFVTIRQRKGGGGGLRCVTLFFSGGMRNCA